MLVHKHRHIYSRIKSIKKVVNYFIARKGGQELMRGTSIPLHHQITYSQLIDPYGLLFLLLFWKERHF